MQDDKAVTTFDGAVEGMLLRLLVEQHDLSGDAPGWLAPAGTVVSFVSDEGDWVIVESQEHGCFGVDKDQLEAAN